MFCLLQTIYHCFILGFSFYNSKHIVRGQTMILKFKSILCTTPEHGLITNLSLEQVVNASNNKQVTCQKELIRLESITQKLIIPGKLF